VQKGSIPLHISHNVIEDKLDMESKKVEMYRNPHEISEKGFQINHMLKHLKIHGYD